MPDDELTVADRLRILEEALRFAGIGLYRYRFEGTLLDINEAAFEILGLSERFASPADVIGRRIEELIVYIGPQRRVRDLIRREGAAHNILYPFRTLSGEERWVIHDSFPIMEPALGEQVVQAIIKDVTTDHQREEALRESEERLRRIVETITDAIVIIGPGSRYVFANPAAERILGLSRDEIVGRRYDDPAWRLSTVDGRPLSAKDMPFMQVMRTGEPFTGAKVAFERPDGRRVILSVNTAPLRDAADAIVGAVVSLDDITEREHLERMRDDFVSAAAHELKTPVATIKGYAQMLLQWAPAERDPRATKALGAINRQSDRITRLVEQLLEFTRLQQHRLGLEPQLFELGELVAETVARLEPDCRRHHITVQRQGAVWVKADRNLIDDVLSNLLDNAVKVMPGGGQIDVAVRAQDGEAIVSVTDHGPGIPPESAPHIFERFYQVPAGAGHGGIGIGLYVSREIITRHGGRIWFESTWGQGATFYFSLPLARGAGGEYGG